MYFHWLLQLSQHAIGQFWSPVVKDDVHKNLEILSDFMEEQEEYKPILIDNEEAFSKRIDSGQIYYHLKNIALTAPVQTIRYI